MKLQTFLEQISDNEGPLQSLAADLMDNMSKADFTELVADMRTPVKPNYIDLCRDCGKHLNGCNCGVPEDVSFAQSIQEYSNQFFERREKVIDEHVKKILDRNK